MRIVLTGGGTGGHIMPLISVARKIKEKRPDSEFIFIGPKGDMEKKMMDAENIPTKGVLAGKARRYFSFRYIADILKVPAGVIQALWHLLFIMPDAIFSKGGYASLPVVIAGWIYRIPIMIHESDSNPGLANSVLSKFSERVAVSYPEAEKYFPASQVVVTGNPLRDDIASGDAEKARRDFSLTDTRKTIFIWGGSLGARSVNNKILDILPELLKKYQIIHQTGYSNFEEVTHKAGELGIKEGREGYHALPFIGEELKDILAVSDLVISRAGSSSISEIAANAKPCILIPLETAANDHQRMNAYNIAKIGGCVVMEEANLGASMLLEKIGEILENDELRRKLSDNIKTFYHPDAAERIADGILGMIK